MPLYILVVAAALFANAVNKSIPKNKIRKEKKKEKNQEHYKSMTKGVWIKGSQRRWVSNKGLLNQFTGSLRKIKKIPRLDLVWSNKITWGKKVKKVIKIKKMPKIISK